VTPEQSNYLRKCNAMGKIHDEWVPYRKVGKAFFTPNGLRAFPPLQWREATHQEIVAEMDAAGAVPLVSREFWAVERPESVT
jgi:hypothetical protein